MSFFRLLYSSSDLFLTFYFLILLSEGKFSYFFSLQLSITELFKQAEMLTVWGEFFPIYESSRRSLFFLKFEGEIIGSAFFYVFYGKNYYPSIESSMKYVSFFTFTLITSFFLFVGLLLDALTLTVEIFAELCDCLSYLCF